MVIGILHIFQNGLQLVSVIFDSAKSSQMSLLLFGLTCNHGSESAVPSSCGEAMTPASKTSRVQRLEKTIKELVDQLNEKTRTLAALEADFDHMVYVVKDFTKKYKHSQSTDEVKSDDLDQQRKALLDKDYEDSPPYILVFHGLQRDWMEQVHLFLNLLQPSPPPRLWPLWT